MKTSTLSLVAIATLFVNAAAADPGDCAYQQQVQCAQGLWADYCCERDACAAARHVHHRVVPASCGRSACRQRGCGAVVGQGQLGCGGQLVAGRWAGCGRSFGCGVNCPPCGPWDFAQCGAGCGSGCGGLGIGGYGLRGGGLLHGLRGGIGGCGLNACGSAPCGIDCPPCGPWDFAQCGAGGRCGRGLHSLFGGGLGSFRGFAHGCHACGGGGCAECGGATINTHHAPGCGCASCSGGSHVQSYHSTPSHETTLDYMPTPAEGQPVPAPIQEVPIEAAPSTGDPAAPSTLQEPAAPTPSSDADADDKAASYYRPWWK